MLPGKKTLTAESLQSEHPEVYAQVLAAGELAGKKTMETQMTEMTSRLATVTEENTKLKNDQKIRDSAAKMNLPVYGEQLITEGKSVEEALTSLISKLHSEGPENNELGSVLRQTASAPAGQASTGDSVKPKTYEEAKAAVKLLKPDLKGSALAREVRRTFPDLIVTKSEEE